MAGYSASLAYRFLLRVSLSKTWRAAHLGSSLRNGYGASLPKTERRSPHLKLMNLQRPYCSGLLSRRKKQRSRNMDTSLCCIDIGTASFTNPGSPAMQWKHLPITQRLITTAI